MHKITNLWKKKPLFLLQNVVCAPDAQVLFVMECTITFHQQTFRTTTVHYDRQSIFIIALPPPPNHIQTYHISGNQDLAMKASATHFMDKR